jgi:hypothetical protein
MSKLSKCLTLEKTNNKKPIDTNLLKFNENFEYHSDISATEYTIGLVLKSSFFISDATKNQSKTNVLEQMQYNAKSLIIEEIFGEFRLPLLRLKESIVTKNIQEATMQLDELYNQMFEVSQ